MIPMFLIKLVGERAAKPVFFAFIAILIAVVAFTLAKCTGGDDATERQAEQTTRSGEGFANAVASAIETIGNRTATDASVDQAVSNVQGNIDNASNPDDLRGAVLDGVCRKASHRNDPACAVR